jgi:hypothetical protein
MGFCLEAPKFKVESQVLNGNSRRVRYENSLSVLDPRWQKALDSLTDTKCLDQKKSFFYVRVHGSS